MPDESKTHSPNSESMKGAESPFHLAVNHMKAREALRANRGLKVSKSEETSLTG